jgi:hypothetical protein
MRNSLALLLCSASLAIASTACSGSGPPISAPMNMSSTHTMGSPIVHPATAQTGFTPGWFAGRTVQFFYHNNNFFCRTPVADGMQVGSDSACEAGSDGTVDPRHGNIPILYVMTPVGFQPPVSTLHCPVAGNCINHPHTIDLSRVFGPQSANVLLPAHSHIVDQVNGNWWELHVIAVHDLATWNAVVAGKSLATVRALQAADPTHMHIGTETLTNLYLYFQVRPGS